MQPAVAGLAAFQPVQQFERFGNPLQAAQAERGDQQKIAVLRRARQQRLGVPRRLGVVAFRLEAAKPDDVLLHLRWR